MHKLRILFVIRTTRHASCYDMTHDRHTLSSPPQEFSSNSFTGTMPTELGNLDQMTQDMV